MNTGKTPTAIMAGAGRAKLEYPRDFFPYRGFNGRYLTGVHDDIYVRAAMITNAVTGVLFVSVETGDLTDGWLPAISRISGIPQENIFLTATHTHEAPYIDRSWPEKVQDDWKTEPFREKFMEALTAAVSEAKDSLRPALMGFGTGLCGINVNRNYKYEGSDPRITAPYITAPNPHGFSDKTVSVLKLQDLQGRTIALVTNYAVHSSVMLFSQVRDGGMLVSGDLAGEAMRYVEERAGGVALFTMSAAGDQDPLFHSANQVFDAEGRMSIQDEGEAGYALVRLLGGALGDEILRVSSGMRDMSAELSIRAGVKTISAPGQKKPEHRPMSLAPDFEYEDAAPVELKLGLIQLNGTAFAGVPAEIVSSIGCDIKSRLQAQGSAAAVVMTQCNGSFSYISDDEGYDERKFDALASYLKKGAAGIITEGLAELYEKLQ